MKRLFCCFVFMLLFIIFSFSQVTGIDKKLLSVELTGEETYFDEEGQEISQKAFKDSINSQKYIFFIRNSIWTLERKYPRGEDIIGKKILFYETKDIYGNKFETNGENITLLSFWDITCSPCIEELTVLNLLVKEFEGLKIVALTKDNAKEVLSFLERHNYNWNNLVLLADYKNEFEVVFVPRVYPANLILDKKNTIIEVFYGKKLRETLILLDSLMKK
ncbi:MAG: TlpA family protein disulfide reductase [Bacteroidales bacterium]|nr:TlpA family protein disulfide reductase [Bacteroidales bacterium]